MVALGTRGVWWLVVLATGGWAWAGAAGAGELDGAGQAGKEKGLSERMIKLEAIIPAAVEDVWAAWTTREGIVSFFGRDAKVELRVGGPFEVYFLMDEPAGSRGSEGCKVLSFVPHEMLAFSWNAPPSMPEVRKERTQVVLRFAAQGARRIKLRLTHLGWGEGAEWDQAFEYFNAAWPRVLDSLRERFARDAGAPSERRPQFVYFIEPVRPTFTEDATDEKDAKVAEHFGYLKRLLAEGVLVLAGRTLEEQPTGIVVFEAEDAAAAREVFENDPAVKAGVFKGRVVPYRVALLRCD